MDVRRSIVAAIIVAALSPSGRGQTRSGDRPNASGDKPNFSGDWRLNHDLSDEPQTGGDDRAAADDRPTSGRRGGFGGYDGRGGHRGRGGFGGRYGSPRGANEEPADERAKIQETIRDARSPSPTLAISHAAANIAITDSRGRTRFFQTSGAKDKHQLDAGTIDSTTMWSGDQLVTQYNFGSGRRVTYTYSLAAGTKQLVVRVRVDGGGWNGGRGATTIKYVYDAARPK